MAGGRNSRIAVHLPDPPLIRSRAGKGTLGEAVTDKGFPVACGRRHFDLEVTGRLGRPALGADQLPWR
jgi:hypothetical protein